MKTTGVKGVCIDVSEHNGKIDWKKIKKDGIKYAIIRVGYGQDHDYQDDKQWANNAKFIKENAKGYGINYDVAVDRSTLREKVEKMIATDGPYLLECAIKEEDNVLPMTPPGKSVNEMLLELDI